MKDSNYQLLINTCKVSYYLRFPWIFSFNSDQPYVCTIFLKIPRSFSLTINACTNSIDQECKISSDHSDIATMIVHAMSSPLSNGRIDVSRKQNRLKRLN